MSVRQPLPVRPPDAKGGTARDRDASLASPAARPTAATRPGRQSKGSASPEAARRRRQSAEFRSTGPAPADPSPHPAPSPDADPDARASAAWRALHDVMDPEFPISIVDLGLVYDVRAAADAVEIDLTFTATGCPCMEFIREDIRERLSRVPGVAGVAIHEVWDPPWTPARISPEGRAVLRRHGVGA